VGHVAILAGEAFEPLTFVDLKTRERQRLRWPSRMAGVGRAVVDPTDRFVVFSFGDPACCRAIGTNQALDLWLLDLRTRKLTHLPGMPARTALKRTDIEWTRDGRLVFLTKTEEHYLVGVWRPGNSRLRVKAVDLPDQGHSFVVWSS
jgi:hypothetical protein